jgi:hypothetical protein
MKNTNPPEVLEVIRLKKRRARGWLNYATSQLAEEIAPFQKVLDHLLIEGWQPEGGELVITDVEELSSSARRQIRQLGRHIGVERKVIEIELPKDGDRLKYYLHGIRSKFDECWDAFVDLIAELYLEPETRKVAEDPATSAGTTENQIT